MVRYRRLIPLAACWAFAFAQAPVRAEQPCKSPECSASQRNAPRAKATETKKEKRFAESGKKAEFAESGKKAEFAESGKKAEFAESGKKAEAD